MTDHFDDDSVGYGRPPKHSRFKPGQSGNPKGRPKRSRNRLTILAEALSQTVTVTENGQRKTLSKGEVIIQQTVNKSASGDPRSTALVFADWSVLDERDSQGSNAGPGLSEAERAVMKTLAERMSKAQKGDDDANQ